MTYQPSPNNESLSGAQDTFSDTQAPVIAVDNTKIDAVHKIEDRWVSKIVDSQTPLIIITEAYAKSFGDLSSYIDGVLPEIPMIFENEAARKKFDTAKFCMPNKFEHRIIGEFEKAAQKHDDNFNPGQHDCIMVFGTPKDSLAQELSGQKHVMIQETIQNSGTPLPSINLAKISASSVALRVDDWALHKKEMQCRPSFF